MTVIVSPALRKDMLQNAKATEAQTKKAIKKLITSHLARAIARRKKGQPSRTAMKAIVGRAVDRLGL